MTDRSATRRRFVYGAATASALALAGCSSGGGGDGSDVPEAYRTATSIGGQQRDPDSLSSQSAVSYRDSPQGDMQCSNCQYYIEDKNDDGLGACTLVKGKVDPEGYCTTWVEYQG